MGDQTRLRPARARGWLAIGLLLATLTASGCASLRWSIAKTFREPGTVMKTFPDAVWQEYDCDAKERPFFTLEENELMPQKVEPAGEFHHRMIYAMCPDKPTQVAAGTLSTRILFKGTPVYREQSEYEIKPGRWVLDSFAEVPEGAEPGVYAYEVEFDGGPIRFAESMTFVVMAP